MNPEPITVLLGDPRLPDASKPGGRFTPDDFDQVRRLKSALSELTAYSFEYRDDHARLFDDLRSRPPSLVLNFCDTGFRNQARHELHVAALLEMLAIPFSGAGPVALGLCYDKAMVRAIADAHGVPVPLEIFVRPDDPVPELAGPGFVKPNRGDGSLGITPESIVENERQLRETVARLRREFPGTDLIVQEFLSGAEYGVGVIGNPPDDLDFLPLLEVDYDALDPSLPRLLDYGSKSDPGSPYWNRVKFRAANLDRAVRESMIESCRILFERLELRDYARFDFRADAGGRIKLLEVNPNPAWCWDGKLAHMAALRGERHSELLGHITAAARRRCGPSDQVARD